MKRIKLSILVGFIIVFSTVFTSFPLTGNYATLENNSAPQSSSDITTIGVTTGDVLYYNFWNEDNGVMIQDEYGRDYGLIKVVVREINTSTNMIYYDFYFPNVTSGSNKWNWDWKWMNDEMVNGSEIWLSDNFTYSVFNHQLVFPNDIDDLNQFNQTTENLDDLAMGEFNCSSIYSEYSTSSDVWNRMYFEIYPDDGAEILTFEIYINKTTGVMTYLKSVDNGHALILELAGFELAAYTFESPDSFGVQPGDWIDRFIPIQNDGEMNDMGGSGGFQPNPVFDDWWEENDDNNSFTNLGDIWNFREGYFDGMILQDSDFYKFKMRAGEQARIDLNCPENTGIRLIQITEDDTWIQLDTSSEDGHLNLTHYAGATDEWFYFVVDGGNAGDKYNFHIKVNSGDPTPDDWLEAFGNHLHPNNAYDNASTLYIHEWPEYPGLISWDDDYYNFTLSTGEDLRVELSTPLGSNLHLQEIDPADGGLVQDIPVEGGFASLDIYPSYDGERMICVTGNNSGSWYDLRFTNPNDAGSQTPVDYKWADYPDWLEPNNVMENATDLSSFDYSTGKWNELNTHADDDYYKFYANSGDFVQAYIEFWGGADIILHTIDAGSGQVIESTQSNYDSGDSWVHEEISWTAAYDGEYYLKVNGSTGYYDDVYSVGFALNDDWGPEYYADGNGGDNNGDSLWQRETVMFVYHSPASGEDVILTNYSAYKSPSMDPLELEWSEVPRVVARVDPIHPDETLGGGWFHKDINFSSTATINFIESNIPNWWDLKSYTLTTGDTWLELHGIKNYTGDDFYFYVEKLPGIGTTQFYQFKEQNETEDRYSQEMVMTIDCSVPGVIHESDPNLGVAEGDWWQYYVEDLWEEQKWGDNENFQDSQSSLILATFTVTHIFALNHTTLGVVGSIEAQIRHDDGSIDPEKHLEGFQPFLVWNTLDPVSFLTMGGFGFIEGPPILLPKVANWSNYKQDMLDLFVNTGNKPGSPVASYFDNDTIRFKFDSSYEENWIENWGDGDWNIHETHEWYQDSVIEVNEFGMTTHLDINHEERIYRDEASTFDDQSNHREFYHREYMVGFMVNASKGYHEESNIAAITGIQPLDTFTWEHSRYDNDNDPNDRTYDKLIIGLVDTAASEYLIFYGAKFWKNSTMSTFQPQTWTLHQDNGEDIVGNIWYLGAIRRDDIWSWSGSQFYDIGITDFANYTDDLVEILSYSFAPEVAATADEITTNGREFTVEIPDGDINHVFKFAMNPQGIMQDMLMGDQYLNGTWKSWQRTVLVDATPGYDTGTVFAEPDNYIPGDNAAPTVTLTSHSNGASVVANTVIQFDVNDDYGIEAVYYSWDGGAEFLLSSPYNVVAPATLGGHSLTIRAVDIYGMETIQSFSFTIISADSESPVITLTSPTAGGTYQPNTAISISVSDNVAVTSVVFNWDGGTNSTATGSFTTNLPAAEGVHIISVWAYDAEGNVAYMSYTFTTSLNGTVVDDNTDNTSDTASDDGGGSPFGDIPGYPVAGFFIFSILGAVALILKRRK